MAVEELHGIFQFTDDIFAGTENKRPPPQPDKHYTPRIVSPHWYERDATLGPSDPEQRTTRFLIADLYRRGAYEQVLLLVDKCRTELGDRSSRNAGALRDLAETAICALLQLARPHEALPLLAALDGVEEPGRLIVKSRVYHAVRDHVACARECRSFLALRPGDHFMMARLADCLLRCREAVEGDTRTRALTTEDATTADDTGTEEAAELLRTAESIAVASLQARDTPGPVRSKLQRDLCYIRQLVASNDDACCPAK